MSDTEIDIFESCEDDFEDQVILASHRRPVLVDFWADWCHPCLVLAPVLENVVREYQGAFALAKIDLDENMRLAGKYKITGIPTVILFLDGEEKDRFSGAKKEAHVRFFVDRFLSGRENPSH